MYISQVLYESGGILVATLRCLSKISALQPALVLAPPKGAIFGDLHLLHSLSQFMNGTLADLDSAPCPQ